MATIKLDSICKSFGKIRALENISFEVKDKEFFCVVGPTNAGKTTTLRIVAGLERPDSGDIYFDGKKSNDVHPRERDVAMLFQNLALYPNKDGFENIATPLRIRNSTEKEVQRRVEEVATILHITHLLDRLPKTYSGGERQRVVIAMALAQLSAQVQDNQSSRVRPILLLDEPTVHLDINHQVEILELIRKLNRERGMTVLATMHDLNLASLYFDRLILLNDGRIVADGAPPQVLSKEWVERVFRTNVIVQPHPTQKDTPHVVLLPTNGNGKG